MALTVGSATTRTPVAAAADDVGFGGNRIAEARLVCSTGRAAADLLPKCERVDETNLFPSRLVQKVAGVTFTETNALYQDDKKNGFSRRNHHK